MNYSAKQYEQDKRQVKDKKALDELFKRWEKVSKGCKPHMINPPASVKGNRLKEKSIAIEIKGLTRTEKRDNNVRHERDKNEQGTPEVQKSDN